MLEITFGPPAKSTRPGEDGSRFEFPFIASSQGQNESTSHRLSVLLVRSATTKWRRAFKEGGATFDEAALPKLIFPYVVAHVREVAQSSPLPPHWELVLSTLVVNPEPPGDPTRLAEPAGHVLKIARPFGQ